MNLGDTIYLTAEYRGYPAGTKGYYGGMTRDSGYLVVAFIVHDDIIEAKFGKHYGEGIDHEELIKFIESCIEFDNMQYNCNLILPLENIVVSEESLNNKINHHINMVTENQKQADFYQSFKKEFVN